MFYAKFWKLEQSSINGVENCNPPPSHPPPPQHKHTHTHTTRTNDKNIDLLKDQEI